MVLVILTIAKKSNLFHQTQKVGPLLWIGHQTVSEASALWSVVGDEINFFFLKEF